MLGAVCPMLLECLAEREEEEETVIISELGGEIIDMLYTGQSSATSVKQVCAGIDKCQTLAEE